MGFQDDSDRFFQYVISILIVITVLAFTITKHREDAPEICKSICDEQDGYYTGYDFTYLLIVECYCQKN